MAEALELPVVPVDVVDESAAFLLLLCEVFFGEDLVFFGEDFFAADLPAGGPPKNPRMSILL